VISITLTANHALLLGGKNNPDQHFFMTGLHKYCKTLANLSKNHIRRKINHEQIYFGIACWFNIQNQIQI
jgi:hypothetical protein